MRAMSLMFFMVLVLWAGGPVELSFNAYKYNSFFIPRLGSEPLFLVKFYLLLAPHQFRH